MSITRKWILYFLSLLSKKEANTLNINSVITYQRVWLIVLIRRNRKLKLVTRFLYKNDFREIGPKPRYLKSLSL